MILGDYEHISGGRHRQVHRSHSRSAGRPRADRPRRRRARASRSTAKGPVNAKANDVDREGRARRDRGARAVAQPVQTGLKAIDAMVPIGRGQRELIIGDRQTGKTAVADRHDHQPEGQGSLLRLRRDRAEGVVDRERGEQARGARRDGVHRSSSPRRRPESAAMQYIAPYSGCTMGEYFRDRGQDALIIYDDLTKQAWAYRQISLLLRRPPGREAYPGDVFYLHSRLLGARGARQRGIRRAASPRARSRARPDR